MAIMNTIGYFKYDIIEIGANYILGINHNKKRFFFNVFTFLPPDHPSRISLGTGNARFLKALSVKHLSLGFDY